MAFAIKAEVRDPRVSTFVFTAQKTMYGGKHIAQGDTVFIFASENEGGQGLIARGVVPDFREPDSIRFGMSPLTTTFTEVARGVELLARLAR